MNWLFLVSLVFFCGVSTHPALAMSSNRLLKLANKSAKKIIPLKDSSFENILAPPHENAYIVALFTATAPEIGCSLCLELESEYDTIVASWFDDHPHAKSSNSDTSIFFTKVNLEDPSKTIPKAFQFFQLNNVPRLFIFKPNSPSILDHSVISISTDTGSERMKQIIQAIKQFSQVNDFSLHLPMDWTPIITSTIITFITVLLFKKQSKLMFSIISSRIIWATLSTFFIICMISAYMFNQIRNTQLAGVGPKGEVMYFLPNEFQHQFAIETQVMVLIYGTLAALVVVLVKGIQFLRSHLYPETKKAYFIDAILASFCALFIYVFFAALTTVFTIKSPAYPFPLLRLSAPFK
ncbi:AHL_G0050260.mRNA.1.CDS.1 [Saccharomyces cerevisiae]|nr:Ost3p [Saccharomyces cerevisiae YJM1252]CAI4901741.1 AHL_G0050260.mRNA.1.CDS.1 [Saccharomyces cerevisiae]CAI6884116.1 AHL_G0050260.mRNA.1.CDS.1 [Saccharomyces cerevisiae]